MKNNKSFKVGDKIIEFGQVYRIFKIKKKEDNKGRERKVIFFKPYFITKKNKSLSCSIPIKNICKTNIRRSMSKNRLGKLLKRLSKKSKIKKQIDINKAREGLSLNKISKTMRVLNRLWREQKDDPTNFSKSRQVILKRAMKRAMEEVALVYKIPLVKARKKIKTALKK